MSKENRIKLSWGPTKNCFFLLPNSETPNIPIFNYKSDYEHIHKICGGELTRISSSGFSGEGYITSYENLIPVGYYRVDTSINYKQHWVRTGNVEIIIPYGFYSISDDALSYYPIVIRMGKKIIYCSYYENSSEIILACLKGDLLSIPGASQAKKVLRQSFIDNFGQKRKEKIEFLNFFGSTLLSPWEFVSPEVLKPYEVKFDPFYNILNIAELQNGSFVETGNLGEKTYAKRIIGFRYPFSSVTSSLKRWKTYNHDILYKVCFNDVQIICFKESYFALLSEIKYISEHFLSKDFQTAFIDDVKESLLTTRFKYCKISVPKHIFYVGKNKHFEAARKALENQSHKDVCNIASNYINSDEFTKYCNIS